MTAPTTRATAARAGGEGREGAMQYHDTISSNPKNGACPACSTVICLRCVVLEDRMAVENYDGCWDCHRTLKRYQAAYRKHRRQDHEEE